MAKPQRKNNSTDYLTTLIQNAPAGWALIRANEIRALEGVNFLNPSLDVGCGDGQVAKVVLGNTRKFDWGIDMSQVEIERAKKSGAYKNCKVASVYDLPFKTQEFKTVFSNSVVEHFKDLDTALHEMARVLKKRGKLIITVPTPYLTEYLWVKGFLDSIGLTFLGTLYGNLFNKMFKHENLYTHSQWEKIFKKHGLWLSQHKYYHSKRLIRIHEFLTYIAIPQQISKMLFGKWVGLPDLRKKFVLPHLLRKLKPTYVAEKSMESGGSCLLVAVKG